MEYFDYQQMSDKNTKTSWYSMLSIIKIYLLILCQTTLLILKNKNKTKMKKY